MGLVERHSRTSDLTHWRGAIPVNYVYTTGRAGEAFFKALGEGQLLATECRACRVTYLPPRIYCERCFARLEDGYTKVPAQGTVHTFTACHKRLDGTHADSPILVAVIRIDQTDGDRTDLGAVPASPGRSHRWNEFGSGEQSSVSLSTTDERWVGCQVAAPGGPGCLADRRPRMGGMWGVVCGSTCCVEGTVAAH